MKVSVFIVRLRFRVQSPTSSISQMVSAAAPSGFWSCIIAARMFSSVLQESELLIITVRKCAKKNQEVKLYLRVV